MGYLLLDPEKDPVLIGYATLTFDSVRLTNSDHRYQRTRCGSALLEAITGLARKLSQDIAVRFLLADANVKRIGFYEAAGFVRNQAKREAERTDPERSVSMRLDLIDPPQGTPGVAVDSDMVSASA